MVYAKTITAAKGGSADSPIVVDFPLTIGLIYQFDLYLPPGSSGLLKVRVADGGAPLWPSEPEEWFYGDNVMITYPDRYFVSSPDAKLQVWYYNEDDTYDHKFTLKIGQVSSEVFIASFLPSLGFGELADAMKALTEGQAEEESARQSVIDTFFGR